jgi:hypothetical protein
MVRAADKSGAAESVTAALPELLSRAYTPVRAPFELGARALAAAVLYAIASVPASLAIDLFHRGFGYKCVVCRDVCRNPEGVTVIRRPTSSERVDAYRRRRSGD